jgi:hypothetical protein
MGYSTSQTYWYGLVDLKGVEETLIDTDPNFDEHIE